MNENKNKIVYFFFFTDNYMMKLYKFIENVEYTVYLFFSSQHAVELIRGLKKNMHFTLNGLFFAQVHI